MTIKEYYTNKFLLSELVKNMHTEMVRIRDDGFAKLDRISEKSRLAVQTNDFKSLCELLVEALYIQRETEKKIKRAHDIFLNEASSLFEDK